VAKRTVIKKVAVPNFSNQKLKKVWEESFGQKNVISETTPFRTLVIAAVVLSLVLIVIVIIIQVFLPPEIPLFYGSPEGQSQIANRWFLVIPSSLSLIILLANLAISANIKDSFLKNSLVLAGLVTTVFATVTTLKIFFLVGNI